MFNHVAKRMMMDMGEGVWLPVTAPDAAFNFVPFVIQQQGRKFRVDPAFNLRTYAAISVAKTYYLNTVTGLDANSGLTSVLPKKTFNAIITMGDADRIIIQTGSYLMRASSSLIGTRNLEIIGEGSVTWSSEHVMGAWTLSAGQTFTFQSSVAGGEFISRVFDEGTLDAFGLPTVYAAKTSIALVEGTAGSKFWSGGILYVHTLDGLTPGGRTDLRYYDSNALYAAVNSTIYIENINFRTGLTSSNTAGGVAKRYFKDCTMIVAPVTGVTEIILQNCKVFKMAADGINYDALGGIETKAIEIDCEIYDGGTNTTDQASSMHAAGVMVRINGKYHHVTGQCIADAGTGHNWLLGSEMYNSGSGIGFYCEAESWLDCCWSYGNVTYDLQNTAAGAIYTRSFIGAKGVNNIAGSLATY